MTIQFALCFFFCIFPVFFSFRMAGARRPCELRPLAESHRSFGISIGISLHLPQCAKMELIWFEWRKQTIIISCLMDFQMLLFRRSWAQITNDDSLRKRFVTFQATAFLTDRFGENFTIRSALPRLNNEHQLPPSWDFVGETFHHLSQTHCVKKLDEKSRSRKIHNGCWGLSRWFRMIESNLPAASNPSNSHSKSSTQRVLTWNEKENSKLIRDQVEERREFRNEIFFLIYSILMGRADKGGGGQWTQNACENQWQACARWHRNDILESSWESGCCNGTTLPVESRTGLEDGAIAALNYISPFVFGS